MDTGIAGFATGLSNSLNQYLQLNQAQEKKQQLNEQEGQIQQNLAQYKSKLDLNKDQALELYKMSLEGTVDPDTASAISPKHAQVVRNWMDKNGGQMPPLKVADKLFDDIAKTSDKSQKSDDIRLTQFARTLSADREFTLSRTKRDNLENVGALIDQVATQPDGPDRRQMYEQSIAQVRVLAGNGQISEKEIEQMTPHTLRGNVSQKLEWLLNHPVGTEAQEFIKRSQDFFHRESKVTNDQISRRMNELSAPYKNILERNADVANETFATYNVNHPKYNPAPKESTQPTPQAQGQTSNQGGQMIHTYPSGKKAIFNPKTNQWEPFNG